MEQIISKEEFDKLMKIKGEARGVAIKGEVEFILKKEGEEGLKKLEGAMVELGYPIKYKEMKKLGFYPLGLEAATLLVAKGLFNYGDKEFQEMGMAEAKVSLIIRLFMRYFFSIKRMVKEAPKMWREHYSVGNLKVAELDEEKRYVILRLENFSSYPFQCQNLIGFFSSVVQMIMGKKVTCEETKCTFRGDDYHEFLLKW